MSELKLCPFCGGEAEVYEMKYGADGQYSVFGVFCVDDSKSELIGLSKYQHGHFIDNFPTEAEAIAAWNTRAATTIGKVQVEVEQVLHGTLTAEQVRETVERRGNVMGHKFYGDWQAIADELNASLGGGECEWTLKEKWPNRSGDDHVYGYETSCGARHTWWPDSLPNFCPTCGGRVKAVEK